MTKVKICGITTVEDAKLALDLGADALGFNFYKQSPRYIAPADAQVIVRMLPKNAWMTGVFVNSTREEVEQIARQVALDTLQLHGDEDAEFCESFKSHRVIKAVRLGNGTTHEQIAAFAQSADFLLIDSYQPNMAGGTGIEVPDALLDSLRTRIDFANAFLAGGLNPSNVAAKAKSYQPFGVDVASGVESAPGRKDPLLLEAFFKALKA